MVEVVEVVAVAVEEAVEEAVVVAVAEEAAQVEHQQAPAQPHPRAVMG